MRLFRRALPVLSAAQVSLVLSAPVFAGPDWTEVRDAGSLLNTAQVPFGATGDLNSISGTLSTGFVTADADFEDCYLIQVKNPALFSIVINSSDFNAQLFIFNITVPVGAYGLLGNDDRAVDDQRPRIVGASTDGPDPVVLDLPGDYMISVSGFGRNPQSQTGAIFNFATAAEISRADGAGGLNRLQSWTGVGATGGYTITMTGVTFADIPAPGSAFLILAGGMTLLRRGRR